MIGLFFVILVVMGVGFVFVGVVFEWIRLLYRAIFPKKVKPSNIAPVWVKNSVTGELFCMPEDKAMYLVKLDKRFKLEPRKGN